MKPNRVTSLGMLLSLTLIATGCGSLRLTDKEMKEIKTNKVYEQEIKVEEFKPAAEPTPTEADAAKPESKKQTAGEKSAAPQEVAPAAGSDKKKGAEGSSGTTGTKSEAPAAVDKKSDTKSMKTQSPKPEAPAATPELKKAAVKTEASAKKRQPELEDSEGFVGRRPVQDPFHVGEKVVLDLSYFSVSAGTLTIETLPFKLVNGRKSYHFRLHAKSNDMFSFFYTVNDMAETFVDFEELIPYNYVIKMNQSKQVGENKALFDWNTNTGYTWERSVLKGKGKKEKDFQWELEPYTQNVLSAIFYLRTFTLIPGKSFKFRVGHRGKNMIMTAKVVRREKLKTGAGTFDSVLVIPTIELDGVFKPVGDIQLWLTDDEHKQLIRLESKIKIGTIVGSATELVRGQ